MTFFQKLGRQRQLLSNIGKRFKKDRSHGALVEALEPRALFSMVPTGVGADVLDLIDGQGAVSAAATANGQYVVAWLGKNDADVQGLLYNVYGTDGVRIGDGGDTTGFIAVTGVSDFEITLNNNHMGAIAWLSNDVVHAQRINLDAGSLLGSEAQVTAPAATDITNINIALDSAGQIALLWEQSAAYDVKPKSDTPDGQEEHVTAESLYLALNANNTTTWSATTTVVSAAAKIKVGSFASIADSDLAIGSDGGLIVAWQANNMTFAYDSDFGKYWPRFTSMDTSFQKYSAAGVTVGATVAVGHKNATHSIAQASIKIAYDSGNGNFTLAQNVRYNVANDSISWAIEDTYDVLTLRTYASTGKPLSAETEVARGTTDGVIDQFTCAFDSAHNLNMLWQAYNSNTQSTTELTQAYSAKGAKVGARGTLNIDHNGYDSISSLTLLNSSTGFRVVYTVSSYDSGTSSLVGSVLSQRFGDRVGDLTVAIGASTLKPTIKTGTATTFNLPVTVTNIGHVTALGKATITVTLVPANGDPSIILTSSANLLLNIAAGKSKVFTLANIKINSDIAAGDYQLVVSISDVAATSDINSANNSANMGLKVINADASVEDIAVASVSAAFKQAVLVPGDSGTVSVVLRNTGTTDIVKGTITLNVSATTDGQYNATLKLISKSLVVTLKAGASATFKLPVTIKPALTQGTYRFAAQVIAPVTLNDENAANDTAATAAGMDVVWSFGNVAGRAGSTALVWQYDNGTSVTYTLAGPGSAVLETNNSAFPGDPKPGDASVLNLSYMDTTIASKLAITVKGGVGYSTIGNIKAYADIGSITAAKTNLRGNASLMTISALTLANMTATSEAQEIDIHSSSTKAVNITLGSAGELMLKSDMAIGTLTALDWTGDDAYLETSAINRLKITGNKTTAAGNMIADVVLTGTSNTKIATLASATVAGALSGLWNVTGAIGAISAGGMLMDAAIRASGNIGSVTAGAATNVSILAGMTADVQDVRTNGATKMLPTADEDFASTTAKINAVTLKGKVGTTVTTSKDFYIAASSVGALKLGKLALGDANAYGVATLESVVVKPVVNAFTSITLTYTNLGKDTTITLTPKTVGLDAKLAELKTALHFDVDMIARPVLGLVKTTGTLAVSGSTNIDHSGVTPMTLMTLDDAAGGNNGCFFGFFG